ncbi:MAG: outer membrane beta-barrel protein [Chitinivibrionales bacterium]|nr:outer membrane beta-barrel protein [Chitinivibrionales bacterium]MBD3355920.1 outer membrane beta-barrel protein [Chitinivibrionales bacterium]
MYTGDLPVAATRRKNHPYRNRRNNIKEEAVVRKSSATKSITVALLLIGAATIAYSDVKIGFNAGLSWPLDEGTEELNMGFRVGIDGYVTILPPLLAGFSVGYSRWGIDEDELIDEIEGILEGDVDGAVHMVELMPNVRLTIPRLISPFDVFGQFGIGVYIRTERVELEGESPLGQLVSDRPLDDTDGRLGLQAGPGIAYNFLNIFSAEVSGLYNLLFEEGPRSQYITLQAGLSVLIPRKEAEEEQ